MLPLLLLLFLVVPLVQLYVIIQVGQAIGALWTIGLLVLDSLLGSLLLRAQGRTVWRGFRATLAAGRPPARETGAGPADTGDGRRRCRDLRRGADAAARVRDRPVRRAPAAPADARDRASRDL